jgi:uncharacterized protein
LFLIAKNDRKMRIEVGYGLEGVLPDVTARRIIAEDVAPPFAKGSSRKESMPASIGSSVSSVARINRRRPPRNGRSEADPRSAASRTCC